MRKAINIVLFLIVALVFCSCQTIKRLERHDVMHIMVYDLENKAVQGMKFTLDGNYTGTSDIYGRLLLDFGKNADSNNHTLKGNKAGYSFVEDTISFVQSGILYYKIGTAEQYLREAEKCADEGDLILALNYIERGESLEKSDDIFYLHAVLLYKTGKSDEALEIIDKISNKNRKEVVELISKVKGENRTE